MRVVQRENDSMENEEDDRPYRAVASPFTV